MTSHAGAEDETKQVRVATAKSTEKARRPGDEKTSLPGRSRLRSKEIIGNVLFVGLDVADLTTIGTFSSGTTSLDGWLGVGRHGCVTASESRGRLGATAAPLLFALLTPFLVLLQTVFFLLNPVG